MRFARTAESVVPDPDPYQRLLQRRRRSQLRLAAAGGGLVAVLVAGALALPSVLPATDRTAGPRPGASPTGAPDVNDGEPINSTWVSQLLDSPTRGKLSADYVHSLVETAQQNRSEMGIAPDLDHAAVLFVDDIGSARVGLIAFHSTERVTTNWYVAAKGASAEDLLSRPVQGAFGWRGLIAFGYQDTLTWSGHPGSVALDALIGLVPQNCRIATAKDAAHHQWVPEPTGSYVAATTARSTEWWKVTCGDTVHYEGPARDAGSFSYGTLSQAEIDAALTGARGPVDKEAAQFALSGLNNAAATTTGPARVLWGGKLPGPTGSSSPAVVAIVPASGGGWLVSSWWQPGGQPDGVTDDAPPPADVTSTDVNLTDPTVVYAVRPSSASAVVAVIAPHDAATATASVGGRQVAQTTLHDGIGQFSAVSGESVTVRAMDSHGQVVGTYVLGHHADDPDPNPDPVINSW
ncbi:hypothetical protein Raf01_25960 [Rugosimonospora africana]|uniref:Uncharacterized protein n=2 Tax=Rugosimonospora africana TaxID=556532 RepID=A0A8J3VPS9_9ACTN|nr:hypothetical protein Raf01_25960 [Rugosimonospora africana]